MKILLLALQLTLAGLALALVSTKRVDLPFSTSNPASELYLDNSVVGDLPKEWHLPAKVGSSHFVHLGQLAGSSSMLHLAFDLDLGAVNRTIEDTCRPIYQYPSDLPRGRVFQAASIFRALKLECDHFRELVSHTKNAFINRFGMNLEQSKMFDQRLRHSFENHSTATSHHREKRQASLLLLIGMGIVAVGSYLFSSHQVAQISVATAADHTTVK